MHLLVLGATGSSGIAFLEEALHANHTLTIYVRSPSKLPQNLANNTNVQIIQGTFDDLEGARKALHTGAEVLVSFAGPNSLIKGTPVTDFYKNLFPMILEDKESSIKRCIICTTPSFGLPEDKRPLLLRLLIWVLKMVGGSAYEEVVGIGGVVSSLPLNEMEWTLFRVTNLTNGKAKSIHAGIVGDGQDGLFLSRKSMAIWILRELKERKWIGKAPALSNHGWI